METKRDVDMEGLVAPLLDPETEIYQYISVSLGAEQHRVKRSSSLSLLEAGGVPVL